MFATNTVNNQKYYVISIDEDTITVAVNSSNMTFAHHAFKVDNIDEKIKFEKNPKTLLGLYANKKFHEENP